ncbi:beta-galactosidase [Nitrospirillum bahiense]|uniref:Beta-galactosidase-like protein n=1 Tax=Nitrospirillum amazonense TaxID=28077 RepID=A0A560G1P6_9PROT|nr:beta-galactosidase [Nitrospirillum amazonense]TWB27825.1 beta-galactosidase-like protein [Nitrospirillum amazonense]
MTRLILSLLALLLFSLPAWAAAPRTFLYMPADALERHDAVLRRPEVEGVQLVYSWKSLEPARGQYDFGAIDAALARLEPLGKKLVIQVQDRFFTPKARHLPDYLLTDPAYGGGLVAQVDRPGQGKPVAQGWVAAQWNPALRARYQALLAALAARFDGRVLAITLPETAADIDPRQPNAGFSCDAYVDATLDNLAAARRAFTRSRVVQYVNFWPCEWGDDHHYMSRLFAFAAANGVGLGGPDIVPGRKAQMANAYPFFNRYKGRLPLVAMAVQEPTLTYTDPKTGKPFTKDAVVEYAERYLGVDIIFWTPAAPWLRP